MVMTVVRWVQMHKNASTIGKPTLEMFIPPFIC